MALTDKGVYAWGDSRHGQLGLGAQQMAATPTELRAFSDRRVLAVACGSFHTLVLTEDRQVFACGWGEHGQLGLGRRSDVTVPELIAALKHKRIVQISAGYYHSAVLSETVRCVRHLLPSNARRAMYSRSAAACTVSCC